MLSPEKNGNKICKPIMIYMYIYIYVMILYHVGSEGASANAGEMKTTGAYVQTALHKAFDLDVL